MTEDYKGPQKAAIYLMSLGEEAAAKVLSQMDERDIQLLGNFMSQISDEKQFENRIPSYALVFLGITLHF